MSIDPKFYRPLQIIAVGIGLLAAAYFGLGDSVTNILNSQLNTPVVSVPAQ